MVKSYENIEIPYNYVFSTNNDYIHLTSDENNFKEGRDLLNLLNNSRSVLFMCFSSKKFTSDLSVNQPLATYLPNDNFSSFNGIIDNNRLIDNMILLEKQYYSRWFEPESTPTYFDIYFANVSTWQTTNNKYGFRFRFHVGVNFPDSSQVRLEAGRTKSFDSASNPYLDKAYFYIYTR